MPIIDELEHPIGHVKIEGPAVDRLDRRKEENNNDAVSGELFIANFNAMRGELLAEMKSVLRS